MTLYNPLQDSGLLAPGAQQNDSSSYLFGLSFTVTANCTLNGVWWWVDNSGVQNLNSNGDEQIALFTVTGKYSGTLVAGSTTTAGTYTRNAWNLISFGTPISLTAGTEYTVLKGISALAGNHNYTQAAGTSDFGTGVFGHGVSDGPVLVYSDGTVGLSNLEPTGMMQQMFKVIGTNVSTSGKLTAANFPTTGFGASWYGMDIQVSTSSPTTPPPPAQQPQIRHPQPAGRARTGSRALCAAGIAAVGIAVAGAAVAGTPPRPFPVSHPQPARAHAGPLGRNAGGQHNGTNQTLITVAAQRQITQPRRPQPQRAIAKGVAGPVNHGYAKPPGVQPRIGHPQPQRAVWRDGAEPGNVPHQFYPPTLPVMIQPRLVPQRALWRGGRGTIGPPVGPVLDAQLLSGSISTGVYAASITEFGYSGYIAGANYEGSIQ